MSKPKNRIGDIIEIRTPKGLAYAQYTHHHARLGALIRVLPGFFKETPRDWESVVGLKERFFTFFPLDAAILQDIVKIVGNQQIPEPLRDVFPLMRVAGGTDRTGRPLNWWIWKGEPLHRVDVLTDDQKKLSIASGWNDTLLVERIVSGWKPEDNT